MWPLESINVAVDSYCFGVEAFTTRGHSSLNSDH
jgi:hypothetical protein